MHIVFTGKLEETRKELEITLDELGHHLQKSLTYQTDMLVVGVRAERFVEDGRRKSTKEIKAEDHGIKIIHVNSINDMLEYFV